MTVDLSRNFDEQGWSIFVPSISSFYSSILSKVLRNSNYLRPNRIPEKFERGAEGLNHLDKDNGYFYYKYGLYSIGHTTRDIDKSDVRDMIIQKRDRKNTLIISDSGGFQIGKGVIKFDWKNFQGREADKVRLDILNWQEHTADWSMVLDVPTWAADHQNSAKTGLKSFQECLDATLYNNDFFVKHRKGNTKYLNVIQGHNVEESDIWYNHIKNYPFEGWALADSHTANMYLALRRIIILRDEGMLDERDLIHVLGNSRLDWSCLLTTVQRELRKQVNPNMMITYDCASPYICTAKGQIYTNRSLQGNGWAFITHKGIDDKKYHGSKMMFPFESEVGNRLTMGDVCWYAPGDLNMNGKEGKTSWDSFSYLMLMAHNVNQHIKIVEHANRLADIEQEQYNLNFREWKKTKRRGASNEISSWVPQNVLYAISLIKEVFASETPMALLDEAKGLLQSVSLSHKFETARGSFNNLFEVEDNLQNKSSSIDMELDDADYLDLLNSIDEDK